jgi:hypothetical protein
MTATADGVKYFAIEGCARQFFKCSALRSTLSVDACAANWRKAQRTSPDELGLLERCAGCGAGAQHAGERLVHRSPLFSLGVCPRCRKGGARFIFSAGTCVSCFNRAREVRVGRNGKGTAPTLKLDPRRLTVVVDGRAVEVRNTMTRDTTELALAALGAVPGKLVFTRARGGPAITPVELAARYRPEKPRQLHGAAARSAKKKRRAAEQPE